MKDYCMRHFPRQNTVLRRQPGVRGVGKKFQKIIFKWKVVCPKETFPFIGFQFLETD